MRTTTPTRRDFLKLAGMAPLGIATAPLLRALPQSTAPNILILVFDAFSAYNIPLYGYGRETTPNLSRLAQRAIVYHNHYAGGNFTSSGTATLLTGALPWTHRALRGGSKVIPEFVDRSLFSIFDDYHAIAYTHNPWAHTLLQQFHAPIENLIPPASLFSSPYDRLILGPFHRDSDTATVSWARLMRGIEGLPSSLMLSPFYQLLKRSRLSPLAQTYPLGLPGISDYMGEYLLEDAVDALSAALAGVARPFLAYFHFLPPHEPYRPSSRFHGRFNDDGLVLPDKPVDIFAVPPATGQYQSRQDYDEFILYADDQLGRFMADLEASGALENTVVVITSDHGEMLERGITGHGTPTLYEPVIRIPLLIFEPGRSSRLDVRVNTSATDVVPTLAHITGRAIPDWSEGAVLSPFGSPEPDPERAIFVIRVARALPHRPLNRASVSIVKAGQKLSHYFGYRDRGVPERIQMFDVAGDPQELVDLYSDRPAQAAALLDELNTRLSEADRRYLRREGGPA